MTRDASVEYADVVVLGAGIAGLTCALALKDLGLRLVVLEREAILGGRASSWTDEATGDPVHIGPHILTSLYPNFLRLLDLLGTRSQVVWQRPGVVCPLYDGERVVCLRGSRLPPPFHYLRTLLGDPALDLADVASAWPAVEAALALDPRRARLLDRLDARTLLDRLGVSPALIRRNFAFTSRSLMNVPLDACSAASLLRVYHEALGRPTPVIGFPGGGLGDLFAPRAERMLLREGHRVWRQSEAAAILVEDTRVTGVVLADGRRLRARLVVSTLPPQALRPLLPPDWLSRDIALSDLEWFAPVPYVSVYLWLDRKVTQRPFWARAFREHDLNCDFYDLSNIYPGRDHDPSIIASNIIDGDRAAGLDDAAIVTATLRELRENLPGARGAVVRHARVHRVPFAVAAPHPGFEMRRPRACTPIDGLLLAGDWTRTGLPSSMESAAASGWRAAELVRDRIGAPLRLVQELPPIGWLARLVALVRRGPVGPALLADDGRRLAPRGVRLVGPPRAEPPQAATNAAMTACVSASTSAGARTRRGTHSA